MKYLLLATILLAGCSNDSWAERQVKRTVLMQNGDTWTLQIEEEPQCISLWLRLNPQFKIIGVSDSNDNFVWYELEKK